MKKKFFFYIQTISCFFSLFLIGVSLPISSSENQQDVEESSFSEDLVGKIGIELPNYNGVEQFILLNDEWVVLVTTNIEEIIKYVDNKTGGDFLNKMNRFIESLKTEKTDWVSHHKAADYYWKYLAEARIEVGEFDLDDPTFYSIQSNSDENYKNPQQVKEVYRFIAGLDGSTMPGEEVVHFAHYSYLNLPFPLKNESTYKITLGNKKEVDFRYAYNKTISRAIKINQLGYAPMSREKFGYLGGYVPGFGPIDFPNIHQFALYDANSGEKVFEGEVKFRDDNYRVKPKGEEKEEDKPYLTGEKLYEMDFSGVEKEGVYFLAIPGVGRSWPFRISKDVFGEAFFISTRALFHQRGGIPIEKPYSNWEREATFTKPVYESEQIPFVPNNPAPKGYERFDVVGATIDYSTKTENPTGGWHDAADWDHYITHYINILDLLYAFEFSPEKFTDGQLNLPESGNGIPDILDEAEFGLRIWKKSMREDGGVAGAVETWTHPRMNDPNFDYAFSKRTRWSSLIFAAAAAQLSQHLRNYDIDLADEYEEAAKRAYIFGMNPKNSLGKSIIRAKRKRGAGEEYEMTWEEKDTDIIPYQIAAKSRLFLLTGDEKYFEGLAELLNKAPMPYAWPFGLTDYSPWLYFGIFQEKIIEKLPILLRNKWYKAYLSPADEYLKLSPKHPYRVTWPINQDYWMAWGASVYTNRSRVLLIAFHLTQDERYREVARINFDYMLGANPLGLSWTTGLGFVYPVVIQHEVSQLDGIKDPVPGITVYGISGGYFYFLREKIWKSENQEGETINFLNPNAAKIPVLRKWAAHPMKNTAQDEFTVAETISSMIFTSSQLMPEGWMPSKRLRTLKPRPDELLFGYWYLP